jgi:biopolymer transport protein ExbB/TolQ
MTWLILAGVVMWVVVAFWAWALCVMAKRGDQ